MYIFDEFDEAEGKNKFWTEPIEKVNEEIREKQKNDRIARSGVTLVVGCPLPPEIQEKILAVQTTFDRILVDYRIPACVKWREVLFALHMTVYGLSKPDDYKRGKSWQGAAEILGQVDMPLPLDFHLSLQGLGILGAGAIAVRISDSKELNLIRDRIEKVPSVSKRAYGEKLNQIIIGRFLPDLKGIDRNIIKKCVLGDLRDFLFGEITVNSFELVHYKHEFLNQVYCQKVFPWTSRGN